MRHPDELIRRYLDGELAPAAAQELRAHLATCHRCRGQLAALERLDARLRALDRRLPARDFTARVRRQVAALPAPRRAPGSRAPLALALLGLLGVFAGAKDLFALATSLMDAANGALGWMIDMISGAGLETGDLGGLGSIQPALAVGLCLIGLASLFVLRESLAGQVEA